MRIVGSAALAVALSGIMSGVTHAQVVKAIDGVTITYSPRADSVDPVYNYVVPKFSVMPGNAPAASVLPAPVLTRFLSSVFGDSKKAVAVLASVNNKTEVPLLIIEKDGKVGTAYVALSSNFAPALVVPGSTTASFAVSMKTTSDYDPNFAVALSTAATTVSGLIGGVPAILLSPAADKAADMLDTIIKKTFTTGTKFNFTLDMDEVQLKSWHKITFVFHQGAAVELPPPNTVLASVVLELAVRPSLIAQRPEGEKYQWPQAQAVLNREIGGNSIRELLNKKGAGELVGELMNNPTREAYKIGCNQLRAKVQELRLNDADMYGVFHALVSTIKPPKEYLEDCPPNSERYDMEAKFNLAPLTGIAATQTDAPWSIFKPFVEKPASAALLTGKFSAVMGRDVRVSQFVPVLDTAVLPVNTGKDFTAAQLATLFKPGVVKDLADYTYTGKGKTTIRTITVNGVQCDAIMTVQRMIDPDSGKTSFQITEIAIFADESI